MRRNSSSGAQKAPRGPGSRTSGDEGSIGHLPHSEHDREVATQGPDRWLPEQAPTGWTTSAADPHATIGRMASTDPALVEADLRERQATSPIKEALGFLPDILRLGPSEMLAVGACDYNLEPFYESSMAKRKWY